MTTFYDPEDYENFEEVTDSELEAIEFDSDHDYEDESDIDQITEWEHIESSFYDDVTFIDEYEASLD